MFGITLFKSCILNIYILILSLFYYFNIVIYDINDISTRNVSFVIFYLKRARPFLAIVHCMHYKYKL